MASKRVRYDMNIVSLQISLLFKISDHSCDLSTNKSGIGSGLKIWWAGTISPIDCNNVDIFLQVNYLIIYIVLLAVQKPLAIFSFRLWEKSYVFEQQVFGVPNPFCLMSIGKSVNEKVSFSVSIKVGEF